MRPHPIRDNYRISQEPKPLYDPLIPLPVRSRIGDNLGISISLIIMIIVILFIAFCGGCSGIALYKLGTSFTDHTATMEDVSKIDNGIDGEEIIANGGINDNDPIPESDTPTIISDPHDAGGWYAYSDHPEYGFLEGWGETIEEAAQDWRMMYNLYRNAPKDRKE